MPDQNGQQHGGRSRSTEVQAALGDTFTHMKTWKILRDCRLKGDSVHHGVHNLQTTTTLIRPVLARHQRERALAAALYRGTT